MSEDPYRTDPKAAQAELFRRIEVHTRDAIALACDAAVERAAADSRALGRTIVLCVAITGLTISTCGYVVTNGPPDPPPSAAHSCARACSVRGVASVTDDTCVCGSEEHSEFEAPRQK